MTQPINERISKPKEDTRRKKEPKRHDSKGGKKWAVKTTQKATAVLAGAADALAEKTGSCDALKEIIAEQKEELKANEVKEDPNVAKPSKVASASAEPADKPPSHLPPIEGAEWVTYHDPDRKSGLFGKFCRAVELSVRLPTQVGLRVARRVDDVFGGYGARAIELVQPYLPKADDLSALEVPVEILHKYLPQTSALPVGMLCKDVEIFTRSLFGIVDDTGKIPLGRYRLQRYTRLVNKEKYYAPTMLNGAQISQTRTTIGHYEVQSSGTTQQLHVFAYTELARQLAVKYPTSEAKRAATIEQQTFNSLAPLLVDADTLPHVVSGTKLMAKLFGLDFTTAVRDFVPQNFQGAGFSGCAAQILTLLATDTALEKYLFAQSSRLARSLMSRLRQTCFTVGAWLNAQSARLLTGTQLRLLMGATLLQYWRDVCIDTVVSKSRKIPRFWRSLKFMRAIGARQTSYPWPLMTFKNMLTL